MFKTDLVVKNFQLVSWQTLLNVITNDTLNTWLKLLTRIMHKNSVFLDIKLILQIRVMIEIKMMTWKLAYDFYYRWKRTQATIWGPDPVTFLKCVVCVLN